MNRRDLRWLSQLLSCPTAPFREAAVIAAVTQALSRAEVPHFRDPVGNIVVGAASRADYRRLVHAHSAEPLRVFIAHMDHPGFHGLRWLSERRLEVKWHGGSPVKHLAGVPVWLADASGYVAEGRLANIRLGASRHAIHRAEVVLQKACWKTRPAANVLYGGFRFRAPIWRAGQRIHTQAADDLVGVFAVVHTAIKLHTARRRPPFLGLLTRAEEVGFVGAIGHFELGWLGHARRPVVCVSLETSHALPGARIGQGPVVRLGDRRTVFDPGALQVLAEVAQNVLPRRHQRRVMDGGTCEATAATAWGFPAIGISVPLGNYHNQHDETGAPAPEYVHLGDVGGMLKLCRALMAPGLPWSQPWQQQRRRLRTNLRRYRKLLRIK